ncbi:hypothetical protein QRX50_35565 [Amycolatopsis carbonis]|uniref:Uncharacterized protein n=1 Tax=Amycolatopsis carbonis TaxID=715471 RepID=A0A9Y2IAB9_9PSEU|nr:hypothetical protein [Amycolatopsis sp. 2-15]WIX76730.1 hypothetical protein QRX50_35565 [Amycolatopsis sp. 2-15]
MTVCEVWEASGVDGGWWMRTEQMARRLIAERRAGSRGWRFQGHRTHGNRVAREGCLLGPKPSVRHAYIG